MECNKGTMIRARGDYIEISSNDPGDTDRHWVIQKKRVVCVECFAVNRDDMNRERAFKGQTTIQPVWWTRVHMEGTTNIVFPGDYVRDIAALLA